MTIGSGNSILHVPVRIVLIKVQRIIIIRYTLFKIKENRRNESDFRRS